jgi:hypothetical protein
MLEKFFLSLKVSFPFLSCLKVIHFAHTTITARRIPPHQLPNDREMVDYRKFDKIGDDEFDSDNEQMKHPPMSDTPLSEKSEAQPPPPQQMTKKGKENRLRFEYQGQLIYEWEQSLEEVWYEY